MEKVKVFYFFFCCDQSFFGGERLF